MLDDIGEVELLLAWGVTVALGWIATIAGAVLNMPIRNVMAVWTVLMALPLLMTIKLYAAGNSNKIFNFWALAVTVLMVENFVTPASIAIESYFLFWIIAGAVGYYYTSNRIPPPSKKIYRYAALASALAVPVVYLDYRTGAVLGTVLQGGPVLYDYIKVHR